jgi:hypothetical protein
MKPSNWIVGGLLLLIVVAFNLLWSLAPPIFSVTPPGQYPLSHTVVWPASQSVGLYRPTTDMGSDEVDYAAVDAKFRCGTSATCPQ